MKQVVFAVMLLTSRGRMQGKLFQCGDILRNVGNTAPWRDHSYTRPASISSYPASRPETPTHTGNEDVIRQIWPGARWLEVRTVSLLCFLLRQVFFWSASFLATLMETCTTKGKEPSSALDRADFYPWLEGVVRTQGDNVIKALRRPGHTWLALKTW